MELQDQLLEEKKIPQKRIAKKNKINLETDSIQYNAQDLEQEQKVDVNPVQLNTQNLVFVGNDYSGKITGTTYLEKNKEIVSKVDILLFFGHEIKLPVYKTNSDNNGNFIIEDIPSGYYTLVAKLGENLKYQSHHIKVLPCQNVHQSILLK
ncbi:MAG: carboxypeptidase regulatory-like domain-containing protein [Clostridiaceae bacterium]|nr:carboxypeptidase regulatory-like domain-containing protein [Clostridiaceae bacterium]